MTRRILSVVLIIIGLFVVAWGFVAAWWPDDENWPEAYLCAYSVFIGAVQFGVSLALSLHFLLAEIMKAKERRVGSPTCIGILVAINIGWVMTAFVQLAFFWSVVRNLLPIISTW